MGIRLEGEDSGRVRHVAIFPDITYPIVSQLEVNEGQNVSEQPTDHTPFEVKRRKPVFMLIASVLLAIFYFGANYFQDALADTVFHFDFAIVNFITALGVILLLLGWFFWLWFVSGWSTLLSKALPVFIALAGIAFVVSFRPVFTGGMGISRWEPRFWEWRDLAQVDANLKTDLGQKSTLDFSQFLGSNRNGVIDNFSAPLDSFYKTRRVYRQDVGQGWSGFAARNGFAITMEQRGKYECVVCYEIETGTAAWAYQHERRHDDALGGVGPRATPTLDDGRVFAQGANGMLVCLDASSGELIWEQDLAELLGIGLAVATDRKGLEYQTEKSKVIWGRAGSPLIVDELVVVPAGGPVDGTQVSLIAFNKADGAEVWRGGDDGIGYGSPNVYQLAGQRQVVIENAASVSGHDPKTGATLWSYDRPGNSDADANTSQAVLVGNGQLLLSKGYGMGGELIEVSKSADGKYSVTSVWKNSRVLKTKLTSAIVRDNYAYALSDGILECVDLSNGKRVWKKGRYGHGQVLLVGDKLLVHSEFGTLHLVEASPDAFNELSEIETVSGVSWNTFCLYDRFIIVRSDIEMACFKVGHDE